MIFQYEYVFAIAVLGKKPAMQYDPCQHIIVHCFGTFLLTLLKWHDRMVIKLNPQHNGMCLKPRFKIYLYSWYAMDTIHIDMYVIGIRNLMNIYGPTPGDI